MPPDDWAYALRLADEARREGRANASVSGQIRLALRDRQKKRHELPSAQFSVALAAMGLEQGVPRRDIKELLVEATGKIERLNVDEDDPATTPAVSKPAARTSAASARAGAPGGGRRATG